MAPKLVRIGLAGLAITATLLAHAPVIARQMVSVARNEVNMRAGPGTRHEAQWIITRGYPLMIVDRKAGWLKVRDFENDVGWVLKSLTGSIPYHIVKVRAANLRARPSAQSRLLGRAVYGEVLRTLEKRKGWIRVQQDGGAKGWIARHLVWGW
ncbi:MAG TPA: SH3 domain-containing protein [Vineibacter sp.]|nr:SH3 domain-containing protein [Vineibacter sp.]